jgi:hypothetical protein
VAGRGCDADGGGGSDTGDDPMTVPTLVGGGGGASALVIGTDARGSAGSFFDGFGRAIAMTPTTSTAETRPAAAYVIQLRSTGATGGGGIDDGRPGTDGRIGRTIVAPCGSSEI